MEAVQAPPTERAGAATSSRDESRGGCGFPAEKGEHTPGDEDANWPGASGPRPSGRDGDRVPGLGPAGPALPGRVAAGPVLCLSVLGLARSLGAI